MRYSKRLSLLITWGTLLFGLGCTSPENISGSYTAMEDNSIQSSETSIELKEDGQGFWRTPDTEVSFRWSIRDNEIRLHTKEGGIIIGEVHGDMLEVTLPGARVMSFRKE
jgi:hypothetical protein